MTDVAGVILNGLNAASPNTAKTGRVG